MEDIFAQHSVSLIIAALGILFMLTAGVCILFRVPKKHQQRRHLMLIIFLVGITLLFHALVQIFSTYNINIRLDILFVSTLLGFYTKYVLPNLLETSSVFSGGRTQKVQNAFSGYHIISLMIFVFAALTLLSIILYFSVLRTQEFMGVTEDIQWEQNENSYSAHFGEHHSVTIHIIPDEICKDAASYYQSQQLYFTSLGFSSRLLHDNTEAPHRLFQWLQSFTSYIAKEDSESQNSYSAAVYFFESQGFRTTLDFYYITVQFDSEKTVTAISIAEDAMLKNHIRTKSLAESSLESFVFKF